MKWLIANWEPIGIILNLLGTLFLHQTKQPKG